MAAFVMEPPIQQIAILHRISSIVASDLSLDEMLGEIVGLTVQTTECDACLVYLVETETAEIVLRASNVPHAADLNILSMKIGEGITGWVAEHKSVVALSENAAADKRFKRFPGLIEDTYEAFLSIPLIAEGDLIGVVNVHHRGRQRAGVVADRRQKEPQIQREAHEVGQIPQEYAQRGQRPCQACRE